MIIYSILAKEEEQEPNVEINNDEIDMGEDEDIDVESDDDDLDTKAEHGMFIDQKNTKKSLAYDRNQVFGLGPKPTPKLNATLSPISKVTGTTKCFMR